MPITRTPMIDDDGSGTTGTIINNAWKQELYGQIDAVTPLPIYSAVIEAEGAPILPAASAYYLRLHMNSGGLKTLNGVVVPASVPVGTLLTLRNVGTRSWILSHDSQSVAIGTGRLYNNIVNGTVLTRQTGAAIYGWTGSTWEQVHHEQGQEETLGFGPANFWGFTCSNLGANHFYVRGAEARVSLYFAPLTIPSPIAYIRVIGWPFALRSGAIFTGSYSIGDGLWHHAVAYQVDATTFEMKRANGAAWDTGQPYYLSFDVNLPLVAIYGG